MAIPLENYFFGQMKQQGLFSFIMRINSNGTFIKKRKRKAYGMILFISKSFTE
jgi:hypothetical protein